MDPHAHPPPSEQPPRVSHEDVVAMMESAVGEFQGFIKRPGDFEVIMREYLSLHNKDTTRAIGMPTTFGEKRNLVRALFDACHDFGQIYEPAHGQSVKRLQNGYYTDLENELILWKLLESICEAQRGHCLIPQYSNCRDRAYDHYDNFQARFNSTIEALRSSKDLVASLFSNEQFLKATNRNLNNKRDMQKAIGMHVAARDDIHENNDGELVDSSGQVYGRAKKRSKALDNTLSKVQPRNRTTTSNRRGRVTPPTRRETTTSASDSSPAVAVPDATANATVSREPSHDPRVPQPLPDTISPPMGMNQPLSSLPIAPIPLDTPQSQHLTNAEPGFDYLASAEPGFDNLPAPITGPMSLFTNGLDPDQPFVDPYPPLTFAPEPAGLAAAGPTTEQAACLVRDAVFTETFDFTDDSMFQTVVGNWEFGNVDFNLDFGAGMNGTL
ncbi:hypothetical protein GGS23DRAFT_618983 [Durotheca rogersii]|uniref:uncharacterized protein n=1 Tax=Durotheca rogersii TaxID=419775 RepID=UPI00221FC328|nr:uncharacterized protein GGS23DRAFT_618983 [Durotheca rogersii]KAI5855068.1 hypothetical protein GGS23DRAFT_618983 [Durotheca rogersii]